MDILVRNVPEDIDTALKTHAKAAGMDRMEFILSQWQRLLEQPIVTERYGYRVYGKTGQGLIKRYSDHPNGTSATFAEFDQEEANAIKRAEDFIRRNQPGDREKAIALLQEAFGDVFEIPV